MNILPMVIAFLMIFSFASYAMLRERIAIDKQEWSYTGFKRIERGIRSEMERRSFKNASPKKSSSSSNESEKKKVPAFERSRRFKSPPSSLGKLSIEALFEEDSSPKKELLYKTAAQLIKLLYENAFFFRQAKIENLEYAIVDALLKKGKNLEKIDSLSSLFPEDPKLAAVYYKMLKGTPLFDWNNQDGYPPLDDFITLGGEELKSAVHFCFAPMPLLRALFGDKVSDAIVMEEKNLLEKKQKLSYLNKAELEGLLSKNQSQIDLSLLGELLDFRNKPASLQLLRGVDTPTSITLKRKTG